MDELDLFAAAIAIADPVKRNDLLDEKCAGLPELRQRIDRLLEAHFSANPLLDQSREDHTETHGATGTRTGSTTDPPDAYVGAEGSIVAGRYKLLQPIGEGGMGSVWMADQTEPVKRRVAVKLIRADKVQSKTILARFEAERQAIALMDHPHIAKLLDAGTTEAGVPYFLMDLVKGIPLTEFCDSHRFTIPERLNLFMQVCSAVQHAHQKGIIHRDLKPSNILVESHDGKPVPKVIDFGLAKATSGLQLSEHTLFTAFGSVMGTPIYMAPEQANFNAVDVDTRADIYALGVVLYELLTGTTPITREAIKRAAVDEMLKLIREEEAPTPSSRLRASDSQPSIAANRSTEPAKLGRFVRGELDWIVLKSLAKERDRRYETASGFAKDIERFLSHEPVQAGPPTAAYRLWKFVQRNRGQVIAASLVLLALVAGIAGTTFGLLRAQRARAAEVKQRKLAQENEAKALRAANAERLAKDEEARQRAAAEAEKKKAIEFRDKALDALRATTGEDVEKLIGEKKELGRNEKAYLEAIANRWLNFARQEGTDEQSRAIQGEGHSRVGSLWDRLGRTEQARMEYQQAVAIQEKLVAEIPSVAWHRKQLAVSRHNFGLVLVKLGQRTDAEKHHRQALDLEKKLATEFPAEPQYRHSLAGTCIDLGTLLRDLGRRTEAESQYRWGLAIQKKLTAEFPGVSHYRRQLAAVRLNLGELLADLGRDNDAEEQQRGALKVLETLAAEFPDVVDYNRTLAYGHTMLGRLLDHRGEQAEAERHVRQALAVRQKLAADFPAVPYYREELAGEYKFIGILLASKGQRAEAEKPYRDALAIREKLAADFPTETAFRWGLSDSQINLGVLLSDLGKKAEAEKQYRQGLAILEKLAADFPAVPRYRKTLYVSHSNLGLLLAGLGQIAEAEKELREALAVIEKLAADFPTVPDYRQKLAQSHTNLGFLLDRTEQRAEEEKHYREALAIQVELAAKFPSAPDHRASLALSYDNLGNLLAHLGRLAEAEEQHRRALAIQEKLAADYPTVPDYSNRLGYSYNNFGVELSHRGQRADAEKQWRRAVAIREKLAADFPGVPEYRQNLALSRGNLGVLLHDLKKWGDADREYQQALAIREKLAAEYPGVPDYRRELAQSHDNLWSLLKDQGQSAEAEKQFREALVIQEKLAADVSSVPRYRVDLGGSYCNLGVLIRDTGKPADSLEWFQKAIDTLRPVHEKEPRAVTPKKFLVNSHWGRALAFGRLAKYAEAEKDLDRAIELSPKPEPLMLRSWRVAAWLRTGKLEEAIAESDELTKSSSWDAGMWYNFACVYALASGKVADKKREYANRAMDLLQKAVKAGWTEAAHMKQDHDLDSLRNREDFKKLLADLEKLSKKK
jgi:tetratricopeptide (TPR) repeat protein/tRNA A-37 threonylcarbamoyl transferase component Bud32